MGPQLVPVVCRAYLAESDRYLFKTGSMRLVTLADELALLDQFLSLMMIRYADGLKAEVHGDARMRWQIAPVVWPELLENAVKHDDFSAENLYRLKSASRAIG